VGADAGGPSGHAWHLSGLRSLRWGELKGVIEREAEDPLMLRRLGIGMLWAIGGYVVGAFGGGFLVTMVSPNRFDRSMEAVMTGAFYTAPLVAVIAFAVGAWRFGRQGAREV
jgi:hypothetical protein